jgi:uncharacterized lipoprotein YehR (DUF1307 family)
MKKYSLFIILFIFTILFTGCSSTSSSERVKITSNGESVNTSKMSLKHCTRDASAGTGIDVSLNYYLYYTGENINILYSEEKIISSDSSSLDEYETAYNNIKVNYNGLEYYDQEVIRGDTTVTNKITINYDKIDTDKLLSIEGEEDNIISDGKAKVDKWITLAKKFGTTCEDVE